MADKRSRVQRRLALDRCLPQFFLNTNSWRGTNHNIVLVFLVSPPAPFVA